MVAFARARQRDVREVLVHEVHPEGVFPVGDPLLIGERHLPPARAEGLGERPFPAELVGDAPDLLHRAHVAELRVHVGPEFVHEDVDAGHVRVGRRGHVVRVHHGPRPFVFPVMARELQVVRLCSSRSTASPTHR